MTRAKRVAVVLIGLASCGGAAAHEGPPYPALMDQPVPGYLVSVWADPDLGAGAFYIVTEPRAPDAEAPRVDVWVEPVSKRLPRVTYGAERQDLRNRIQFVAKPEFDRQEMWTVGIVIHTPHQSPSELNLEVEVTSPGLGAWGLAIYSFPFLLFGGLWAMRLIHRWRN